MSHVVKWHYRRPLVCLLSPSVLKYDILSFNAFLNL